MELPSIDQNICGTWTQLQTDFYNKLPFYFIKAQAAGRKRWQRWAKKFGRIPWKANMGDIMRRVMAEPTPVLRQEATPQLLSTTPTTDVIDYRERIADTQIRWQQFISPNFNFLPEFQDFMKHIDETMDNINQQMAIFEDIFYRSIAFHSAPYVYLAGVGLVDAPTGIPNAAHTSGKTNAWLQAQFARMAGAAQKNLTYQELYNALTEFTQTVGATPMTGSGLPQGDSEPLNEVYGLIQSSESWYQWVNDPWVKENRQLEMNIVTKAFSGDAFGRVKSDQERFPLRYATDVNFSPTMYVPESVELDPNRIDYGRTKPNPQYASRATSQWEVAFLIGGQAGDIIDIGPPPAAFTQDLEASTKMNWNGKAYMTKNILVPCLDALGNTFYDANSFGNFLRIQSQLTIGLSMINPQNILPIIYQRRSGLTNATSGL